MRILDNCCVICVTSSPPCQVEKVEGAMAEKFHEQERKWQARLDAMSQRHKEELEQVSDTSSLTVMTSLSLIKSSVSIKFFLLSIS